MERVCLMKWQYVKVAACINCRTAQNSEGTVNEKSRSNKLFVYCENIKGLNGLIMILDS